MNLQKTNIPIVINQKKFEDSRGYFQEIYLEKKFKLKIKFTAVAYSKKKRNKRTSFSVSKQTIEIYLCFKWKNFRCSSQFEKKI